MSAELVVSLHGRLLGRATFKQPVIRIGRSPENDVSIDNPVFSRYHARIHRTGGVHELVDLDTPNGTFVNGKRVRAWNLGDGDRIAVGKFTIEFHCRDLTPPLSRLPVQGGATIAVANRGTPEEDEARCPLRGRLLVASGERRELARDSFLVGGDRGSDLVVPGWLTPRRIALVARGLAGFAVVNLAGGRWVMRNGNPVAWQSPLASGDELRLGRIVARFELCGAEAGRPEPCRT